MKGYITFVLVVFILASLIAMDVLLNSIGREKSPILTQEKMFYSNVESSRRIEEAALVGSSAGINLYIKYKEAEFVAELLATGGTVVPGDVAKSIDLDEMEAWSNAGALVELARLNQNLGLNNQGFYCTWAADSEIGESMRESTATKVLTLPRTRTVSLNIDNCKDIPHSQINFIGAMEDLPVNEIKAGNLSALDVSITLYDEAKPEHQYNVGRVASLYYDSESNTASLTAFPETRKISAPYVSEMVVTHVILTDFSSFFRILNDQYGIRTNETIAEKLINSTG